MAAAALIAAISFTSCGSDDKDEAQPAKSGKVTTEIYVAILKTELSFINHSYKLTLNGVTKNIKLDATMKVAKAPYEITNGAENVIKLVDGFGGDDAKVENLEYYKIYTDVSEAALNGSLELDLTYNGQPFEGERSVLFSVYAEITPQEGYMMNGSKVENAESFLSGGNAGNLAEALQSAQKIINPYTFSHTGCTKR